MTPLLQLLADGQFHTGPQIADQLGVTRAAINMQVQAARARGLHIESVQSRGYRMPGGAEWLDAGRIKGALRRTFQGCEISLHESIESTNEWVMRRTQPWPDVEFCFAEHQSAGRGRRGRTWVSPWGHNLFLTVALTFQSGLPEALSLRVGVGVAKLLKAHGVGAIGVKWPNDLWVAGHKCGGILVELQGDPTGHCRAIIGVGLNLHTPAVFAAQIDQPYADLRLVGLDASLSRSLLASRVARAVAQAALEENDDWLAGYAALDCLLGKSVEVFGAGIHQAGVACGVEPTGELKLETERGVVSLRSGEISVRPNA